MTQPFVDLERAHFRRVHGDITVIGTWLVDGKDNAPCLALIPTGDELNPDCRPSIVPLGAAWRWARETNAETEADTIDAVIGFMVNMRREPHLDGVMRIMGIVEDNLQDLLSIPPYRPEKGDAVADLTITGSDGSVREVEIPDDV